MNPIGKSASSLAVSLMLGLWLCVPANAACTWSLFPTENPEPSGNQLNGVAGTAPGDVWETGAAYHQKKSDGYALHWNGVAWTAFAQSDPNGYGGQFSGVAALARNDVWVVGQSYAAPNYAARRAVAEFWNGSHFSVAALPAIVGQDTFLYGIAAIGPSDIWAAGGAQAPGGLQQAYVVHWDGKAWTQSAALDIPNAATNLDAIASTAPNDVWSVGGSQANASAPFRTLAQHWDGTRWSVVPTPNVNANSNVFNAVVALSPSDAWAIGDYYNGKAFSPLAEHWDGRVWSIVATPNTGAQTAFMYGATAASPHEVWAVGEIAKKGGGVAGYILRWNGTRWYEAPSPNVPHRLVTLLNAVTTIPGGMIWAVGGDANTKIVIDTVTEVRACAKEPPGARR